MKESLKEDLSKNRINLPKSFKLDVKYKSHGMLIKTLFIQVQYIVLHLVSYSKQMIFLK